jgi:hypothetical protein
VIAAEVIAAFVERQRRERVAAGLPETIIDPAALRLVAAVVRPRRGELDVPA